MITAMCVSPCVDRIYCVNNFETGKMYRVSGAFVSAGGKGVNVARAASLMGEQVKCIGFKAGYAGQWLEKQVMGEGIEALFVEAEGETRTNINIIYREGRTETEILEPGPEMKPGDIAVFMDAFEGCLKSTGILVCSGGLARGLPADFYREIIIRVRKKGIKVLLDSSGQSLDMAIRVGPYMVKPNMRELKGFASGDLNTDGEPSLLITFNLSLLFISSCWTSRITSRNSSLSPLKTASILWEAIFFTGSLKS